MAYEGCVRSQQKRELCERKAAAAEFYRVNRVPEELERALNQLVLHKPADVHGYLVRANYFANLSAPPRITRLRGRQVYDTRGQLTVEADVFCNFRNNEKKMCSAAVPCHFGAEETAEDLIAKCQNRVDHVMTAVQWINEPLTNILKGLNPYDQSDVDHAISNFFMERYLEEQNVLNRERAGSRSPSESEGAPSSAQGNPKKDKKTTDKGKKSNTREKAIAPAEPPELVLPGSMAIGSVSLAVARTGTHLQGIPLYKYIAALKDGETPARFHIPICLVTLMSCGKTSPGKLKLWEEVILIPKAGQRVKQVIKIALELQKETMRIANSSTKAGATHVIIHDSGAPALSFEKPEQPLDHITEACANLGLQLGTEICLGLNCAAFELMDYSKGKYEVASGALKSPDELVDMYQALIVKYPAVVALINPLRKEDTDQWEKLSSAVGDSCSLLFDITYGSKAPPLPGVNGYIYKLINETTISDLVRITSGHQDSVLLATACDEPCGNNSLSDIAVGLGLNYVKLGGLSGAEKVMAYNRLISIEEELSEEGILVTKEKHPPPLPPEKPQEKSPVTEGALSDEEQPKEQA